MITVILGNNSFSSAHFIGWTILLPKYVLRWKINLTFNLTLSLLFKYLYLFYVSTQQKVYPPDPLVVKYTEYLLRMSPSWK